MTDIKLRRKKVVIPDDGYMIQVVWADVANPLKDESGNIIYTDKLNENGIRIPEYMEFVEYIQIPTNISISQTTIDELLAIALESAKQRAQTRIDNLILKEALRPFVQVIDDSSKIDFEGTVPL